MKTPRGRTLFTLLCKQAERFGERIAVIDGTGTASYRELADAAGRVGGGLRASGIRRGTSAQRVRLT